MRLDTPVGGQDFSTVHAQGEVNYKPGARISILVDPRDPSYSELPGVADDDFDGLVLTAIVVLLMTFFVAGGLVAVFRERSKRLRASVAV